MLEMIMLVLVGAAVILTIMLVVSFRNEAREEIKRVERFCASLSRQIERLDRKIDTTYSELRARIEAK